VTSQPTLLVVIVVSPDGIDLMSADVRIAGQTGLDD
jgi:hypothetical protein